MDKPKETDSANRLLRRSEQLSKSAVVAEESKTSSRKTLVRNTERPVSKTTVVIDKSKTSLTKNLNRNTATSSKNPVIKNESKTSLKKTTSETKSLVRNTEKPIPKKAVVIDESKGCIKKTFTEKKPKVQIEKSCAGKETNLDLPELYSTLHISKKIDDIVNPRIARTFSNIGKTETLLDEKARKKVNFPYDQAIYKDLVPLTATSVKSKPKPVRNPLPQKDPVPVLSDYITPFESPQYCYIPEVKFDVPPVIIDNNPLRLYKLLEIYEKERPI